MPFPLNPVTPQAESQTKESIPSQLEEVVTTFDESYYLTTTWNLDDNDSGIPSPASVMHPGGLSIDSLDNIYISDWSKHKIKKFDSNGSFITDWDSKRIEEELVNPSGIAVDSLGNVYIYSDVLNTIQVFSPTTETP